ncbi:HEAT repeat domain-containing protein [Dactylosporangium cerinum]|uniref:HEAT repeat domain-containing protein n=1 Tax=Dactylosporangium cerinum TaxID=1434730 RepID=A0ABV9W3R7_9ACTN
MEDRLVHPPDTVTITDNALLHAAIVAGHGDIVRDVLDNRSWPTEETRDNIELLSWAADYGAYAVIHDLLGGYLPTWGDRASEGTVRTVLEIARSWVGVDPVAELRRRLGDEAAVVTRETVPVEGDLTHADRVRVTTADGRWAEVQTTHLGIVTYIEDRLGTVVSRDALLARALTNPDTDSVDWSQAWFSVGNMPDVEATYHWAAGLLADSDPEVRRFAAEVVAMLSRNEEPCREEALAILRARMPVEPNAEILSALIDAFGNYQLSGDMPEVEAHIGHPDPRVRRQVAEALINKVTDAASAARAIRLLTELGSDSSSQVRSTVVRVLRDHAPDSPVTRQLLASGRDDPDPEVRLEALAGLARYRDAPAYEQLRRLADEAGEDSHAWWLAYDVERHLRTAD